MQILDWDSTFFGVSIGRATGEIDLDAIVQAAEEQQVACVYIESGRPLDPGYADLRLADRRVLLSAPITARAQPIEVRATDDLHEDTFAPVLQRLAPWSRFARDPGFGTEAARRMYEAWLRRALASDNERVGVLDGAGDVRGFVTIRLDSDSEIGLIGADSDGSGAGQKLIDFAFNAAAGSRGLEVVTQADNTRALMLYERNGFVRKAETLMYHLWLNDEEKIG